MNLADVSEWLKTSIPGIILLGAIGSIAAVFLLRYVAPPLRAIGLKPFLYFRKEHMWRYWRSAAAYAHIESDSTNRKLIFYLFRHSARLLLALTSFITTTVVFAVVVASRSEVLLTYGTFILSMLAFLSAYWARIEYDYITINYVIEWRHTGLVRNPFPNDPNLTGTNTSKNPKKVPSSDGV